MDNKDVVRGTTDEGRSEDTETVMDMCNVSGWIHKQSTRLQSFVRQEKLKVDPVRSRSRSVSFLNLSLRRHSHRPQRFHLVLKVLADNMILSCWLKALAADMHRLLRAVGNEEEDSSLMSSTASTARRQGIAQRRSIFNLVVKSDSEWLKATGSVSCGLEN